MVKRSTVRASEAGKSPYVECEDGSAPTGCHRQQSQPWQRQQRREKLASGSRDIKGNETYSGDIRMLFQHNRNGLIHGNMLRIRIG